MSAAGDGPIYADAVRFISGDAIGGDIEYSHTDQIGTIQKLTDATGALVWDRIARPFGETVSINAASGAEQKLRFPGQYADETGLSYNYFRDYDPTVGRYAESDPIGLRGGTNGYLYANANALLNIDPKGLKCHPVLIEMLQFQVNKWCKWSGERACKATDTCAENARKLAINSKCAEARRAINQCLNNGTHDQAEEDAVAAVRECQKIRQEKFPWAVPLPDGRMPRMPNIELPRLPIIPRPLPIP